RVAAVDKAGNSASDDSNADFTIDSTNPTVSITDIPDFVNTLDLISGTASDTAPGELEKVQVQINNTTDSKYWDGSSWVGGATWLDVLGTTSWVYVMPTLTNGKAYTVKAKSIDKGENESVEASDTFTVEEKEDDGGLFDCVCDSSEARASTTELLIGWGAVGVCWGSGYLLVRRVGRRRRE
ncbi:unnamed protein product, partial [marine sediment metagenome]